MTEADKKVLGRALVVTIFFVLLIPSGRCDTPANCTFEDIAGTWYLYETPRNGDHSIDCLNNSKYEVHMFVLRICLANHKSR